MLFYSVSSFPRFKARTLGWSQLPTASFAGRFPLQLQTQWPWSAAWGSPSGAGFRSKSGKSALFCIFWSIWSICDFQIRASFLLRIYGWGLVHIRDNAEAIAFYGGEKREQGEVCALELRPLNSGSLTSLLWLLYSSCFLWMCHTAETHLLQAAEVLYHNCGKRAISLHCNGQTETTSLERFCIPVSVPASQKAHISGYLCKETQTARSNCLRLHWQQIPNSVRQCTRYKQQ